MAYLSVIDRVVGLCRSSPLVSIPSSGQTARIRHRLPTIEELETRCLPVSPGTTAGFVTGMYQNVLDRAPDPAGFQFWVGQLNASASRKAVANSFWKSDERHGQFLADAYQIYLRRSPEAFGLSTWLTTMRSGLDDNQLIQAFVSSAEYQTLHRADGDFIQSLYTDLLGRDSDPVGLAGWKASLQQGMSRAVVATGFMRSTEFATLQIQVQYETRLNREGSAAEVSSWLPQNRQSGGLKDLAVSFLASNEFFQSVPGSTSLPNIALFNDATETVFQIAALRNAGDPANPAPPKRHFVANADESHQDLLNGIYPVVGMSLDDVISLSQSKDPNASKVVFFSGVHRGFLQLMARPGINSIADLRGKNIAVDTTTGYAAALFEILKQNGLEAGRDFNVVFAGATNVRYQKLLEGEFDATLLGTPFTVLAEEKGFQSLARPIDILGGYQGVVFAALRPWLATHPELARRLVSNFHSTVQWAQQPSNRPAVVSLVAQTLAPLKATASASAVADGLFGPQSEFNPNGQIRPSDAALVIQLYNSSRGGKLPADIISRIYMPIGNSP